MITTVDIKTGKVTQRELTPEEQAALPVRTEEEIAAEAREAFKQSRAEVVSNIKVVVNGNVYDGDETSQARMGRAIVAMTADETIKWVLADNSTHFATKEELTEALRLAGAEQTRLWVMPVINLDTEEEVTDGIN